MAWALVCIATFGASLLTFFSGFGLGTLLMPVAAFFMPVPVAIAMTAIVHLMSKLFKIVLLWRHIDGKTVLRFGLPALVASIPGALLLGHLAQASPIAGYTLLGHGYVITPVKLTAGLLLIFFATAEWVPFLQRSVFKLGFTTGGALSGFFGGLTGHQGAFRSAFLVQGSLSEQEFVATNAAIAALVDISRLAVYGLALDTVFDPGHITLVALAVLAAFLGTLLGNVWLAKTTIRSIQRLVALMMYVFGGLLCGGII